ncbi:hypothetical protein [Williamsia sp.]|uniref:hypothetical protein n=1 Tax=Williamsia sp. TaxID=1872085 RepID=UPI002F93A7BA
MSGPAHLSCPHCGGGLMAAHQPWCPRQPSPPRTPPVPPSGDTALIALFEDYCTRHDEQIRELTRFDDPEDMALAFARASVYLDCAERLHATISDIENQRSTTAS